jgi:hypothetical protein
MSKKYRKNRILTVRIGETPTKERRNHNGGVIAEIADRDSAHRILIKRFRAVWECPLDKYRDDMAISLAEHQAGLKFKNAYYRAVLGIKVSDIGSGCKGDWEMASLTAVYSERLLIEAYQALSPKQKAIVINVCGHDEVAGTTARLKTLHRGLMKLCNVWKISDLANNSSEKQYNCINNENNLHLTVDLVT